MMRAETSCIPARNAAARPVGPPPMMVRSLISMFASSAFRTLCLSLEVLRRLEYLKFLLHVGAKNVRSRHDANQLSRGNLRDANNVVPGHQLDRLLDRVVRLKADRFLRHDIFCHRG